MTSAGAAGRSGAEHGPFQQKHFPAAQRQLHGGAGAGHTAADDNHVGCGIGRHAVIPLGLWKGMPGRRF